jgi:HSP20 family protein
LLKDNFLAFEGLDKQSARITFISKIRRKVVLDMLDLIKYNPFRETLPDRLFRSGFFGPSIFRHLEEDEEGLTIPKVDVTEGDKEFTVTAEVPGYAKEEIKVEVENGRLSLHAEHKEEKEEKKEHYHLRERRYGSFTRTFGLPENVDAEKIEAKVKDGVLTVSIPKVEETKPKAIEIKTN